MSVMVWQVHLVRSGFFNAGSAMLWLQLAMIVFQKTLFRPIARGRLPAEIFRESRTSTGCDFSSKWSRRNRRDVKIRGTSLAYQYMIDHRQRLYGAEIVESQIAKQMNVGTPAVREAPTHCVSSWRRWLCTWLAG
jgi:hypothetical protein